MSSNLDLVQKGKCIIFMDETLEESWNSLA